MSGEPAHWTETLQALLHEIQETHEHCDQRVRDEVQVMINFIALAPFADPTRLPPFVRYVAPRRQPPEPPRPPRGGFSMPVTVPAPRTPPHGHRRVPRDHE